MAAGPAKIGVSFPPLTLAVFLLPIGLGLLGTWLPAFGYFPAIGAHDPGVFVFTELIRHPSLPGALQVTILSGVCATVGSLLLAFLITVRLYGSRVWYWLEKSLSPLLSVPHAAFAIGFGFLIAPSGWLIRMLSPALTGFSSPPDWITVGDPWGVSLCLIMIFKEIPFLLLIILAALNQIDTARTIWVGRSLGYSRIRIWTRLVLPQLYPMLRLPVLAVLAYSLSVVDLALLTGPSVPPSFAVLIDRWFNNPDPSLRLVGGAGASLLFLLTALFIFAFLGAERLFFSSFQRRIIDGRRTGPLEWLWKVSILPCLLVPPVFLLSMTILGIWSCTRIWRFPDFFPETLSLHYWSKSIPLLYEPLVNSVIIAVVSTLIALLLVLGCFENETALSRSRFSEISRKSLWIIYLPLLIPQVSFLFGAQSFFLILQLQGTLAGMVWIHLVFVLPYVFLTLANTYRSYDHRFTDSATLLSGSAWKSFLKVKLVMLIKPILFSTAVGFSVSIAQYLPTLYVGAGRFATVTTETVSLASGSDRRVIAVYALCQLLLPLVVYTAAILIPSVMFRKRTAMQN